MSRPRPYRLHSPTQMARARQRCGLSQTEAGALIGKTQSHYQKIERHAINLTAVEALILCRAYEVPLEYLVGDFPTLTSC